MTATQTTTTTTTTVANRQGVQLSVGSQANTQSIGTYVTDVSISPYINPTIISFFAYNLRPNQRIHVFFDSMNVDQYSAPSIIPTSQPSDTSSYTSIIKNGNWGDAIYTDSLGRVSGQFNVPAATFKTGDRLLQLADVSSLSLGFSAVTTLASATFTASNLSVTKQTATLTTVNPTISSIITNNSVVNTQVSVSNTVLPDIINVVNNVITNTQIITQPNVAFAPIWVDTEAEVGVDPLAQALTISTPLNQAGVFVTSLDLFFQQRSQLGNNGVMVYLCEMDNGYPNTNCVLPFSLTHLPYANIAVSATANVSTNFRFEAPVFLSNNKDYAFVVKPDANDPDYTVYTANIGDIDIATGYQVFSQPLIGTAFYGATQQAWTALQTEYIKFNLRRATFMSAQGDAYFYNSNNDYINITGLAYTNTTAQLLTGDYVYGATSNSSATANAQQIGTFDFYDNTRQIVYITDSTGKYPNTASIVQFHRFTNSSVMTPNSTTLVAYANTTGLYNLVVDAIVPQVAAIAPAGTTLQWDYTGTSNTYVVDGTPNQVVPGNHREFYDEERIVASLSNETTALSGAKSAGIHASLSTTTSWLSPLIDTVRNQQLVIANKIDAVSFNYNEFYNYSNTQSKYVSRIITLAQGQDAEDIQISLTAHRPPGTDVSVWVKFLAGEDADPINLKTWTPLINQGSAIYSDPSNPTDFKEFNYVTAGAFNVFNTSGTVTCNNSSANVTGVATSFGNQIKVGYWVTMAPNTTFTETARQVINVINSTVMILNSPFVAATYAANAIYVVVPPTTAYKSLNTHSQAVGTVTTSLTNNSIIGSGTNFLTLIPGQVINVANDNQVIVSITNSTYLTVGSPWSSTLVGANVSVVTPTGITYLNSNNALYNTFKQFQIKIILQSNDSSKVPYLDDLRCLALQL